MEDKKSKELLEMEEHKILLEKLSKMGFCMTLQLRRLREKREQELQKQQEDSQKTK